MTGTCPCGRSGSFGVVPYAQCCGQYLESSSPLHLQAPDAEALMRSRYTAYTRGATDYVLATWAAEHRPAALDDAHVTWLGLQVHSHRADGDVAEVDFSARYVSLAAGPGRAGPEQVLRERSRFARRHGRWFYLGS